MRIRIYQESPYLDTFSHSYFPGRYISYQPKQVPWGNPYSFLGWRDCNSEGGDKSLGESATAFSRLSIVVTDGSVSDKAPRLEALIKNPGSSRSSSIA